MHDRDYSKESLICAACHDALAAGTPVIIGVRADDVRGAKRNGLMSVAVTWGYGHRDELEAAQPDCIVTSGTELLEYIRRVG